jgi:hypothetical protein
VRRRAPIALAAASLACLGVASAIQGRSAGADWTRPLSIESDGITAYYPRAWHAAAEGNTIVISSRRTSIWLASYGPAHADEYAARPEHFELKDEDRRFQTCGLDFVGWNLTFTDHGQVLQAIVRVEPGAPRSDAAKLLDRLEIG